MSVHVRMELPAPLRSLAKVKSAVVLEVEEPATQHALVSALEERYPMLRGTVRDLVTGERRAYLRFFACGEDLSHLGMDALLPEKVIRGEEPFLVVGAVSGGL
ncbi:MAG TPA: MoaD/ThiS family protein [Acidobacteriaceae bacterium]|jgi:molybdopterin converting factor small subunit